MKLWPTTTKNKCFVKILWHLLGECVKLRYFWFVQYVLFFFNHRFVLFFLIIFKSANAHIVFCTIHPVFLRCTFTVPFCWAFFIFIFFYIYILKFWTVPSWFNQLCWAKFHYSTYNFFRLIFCIFFSLHTILNKNI